MYFTFLRVFLWFFCIPFIVFIQPQFFLAAKILQFASVSHEWVQIFIRIRVVIGNSSKKCKFEIIRWKKWIVGQMRSICSQFSMIIFACERNTIVFCMLYTLRRTHHNFKKNVLSFSRFFSRLFPANSPNVQHLAKNAFIDLPSFAIHQGNWNSIFDLSD